MRTITSAEQNQTAGLIPWRVMKVNALPDCKLFVQFVDGTQGTVEMKHFLARDCGVFKALRDGALFQTAHVENGAVTWENGLDLAPDQMHQALQTSEVYVVQ